MIWRSQAYLRYIRSLPCVVTGRLGVVAHHVRCLGHGGTGLKPPDWMAVPLDPLEHQRLHDMGERRYWAEKGITPALTVCWIMLDYLQSRASVEMVDVLGEVVAGING